MKTKGEDMTKYIEVAEDISVMHHQLQEALLRGHIAIPPFAKQLRNYLNKLIQESEK